MSIGGIAANATLVVAEGQTAGEARAEASATAIAQAAPVPVPVADTFIPSNPGIAIPELGDIQAPSSGAYHDLQVAKRELRQARHEPEGTAGRRADIREARRDVRHAKAALNAETSGAGSALLKDTFGSATTALARPGAIADDNFDGGAVKAGWGQNGNGRALGHDLPFINQLDPAGNDGGYTNAEMNCAPTALAMVARQHPDMTIDGNPVGAMSDAELINALGRHADTNWQGTSPNGVIAAAEDLGFRTNAYEGGYNANFVDSVLAQGGSVIANGAYEIGGQLAGHFVTVAARNQDGSYLINDPLQGQVVWTADELNRFLLANPKNHGVSIGIV